MTSLAKQLQQLALPQNQDNQACEASILFDKKTATHHDKDTVYALGVNGFREIMLISGHLSSFESLFSEQAKDVDFRTQSKQYNEKLRAKIDRFLIEISPYFLLRPSLKCLEWLIYRFRIQDYNVDGLLSCAFPYYSTNLFVRAVQTINLNSSTKWSWLKDVQVDGVSPTRNNLTKLCSKSSKFFHFMCNMIKNSVEVAESNKASTCSQTITFFTSILLGSLASSPKKGEVFLQQLLPILTKGLKSKIKDYQASSFMLVSQLSVNINFSEDLVDHFIKAASRNCSPALQNEMMKFCLLLCRTSQSISDKTLRRLKNLEGFQKALVAQCENKKFQHFLLTFLEFSISNLQEIEESMEEECKEVKEMEMICSVMTNPNFSEQMYKDVLKFVFSCLTITDSDSGRTAMLLQRIQESDSDKFYGVLRAMSTDSDVGESWQEILSSTNQKFSKDTPSLMCISLYQRHAQVRINAVNNIAKLLQGNTLSKEKEDHVVGNVVNTFMLEENAEVDAALIELFLSNVDLVFYNVEQVTEKLSNLLLENRVDSKTKEKILNLIFNVILTKNNNEKIPQTVEMKMFFVLMSIVANAVYCNVESNTSLKLIQESNFVKIYFTKKMVTDLVTYVTKKDFQKALLQLIALTCKYAEKKLKQIPSFHQDLFDIAQTTNDAAIIFEQNLVYFIFLASRIRSENSSDVAAVCSLLTSMQRDLGGRAAAKTDLPLDEAMHRFFQSKSAADLQQLIFNYAVEVIDRISALSGSGKITKDDGVWRSCILLIVKIRCHSESGELLEGFCEKNFAGHSDLLAFVCRLICESYGAESFAGNFGEVCKNRLAYCDLRGYLLTTSQDKVEVKVWTPLIASMLIDLSSTMSEIRNASLQCFEHISTLNNRTTAVELAGFISKNRDEINADSNHVKRLLKKYFSEENDGQKVKKDVLKKRDMFFDQITKYVFDQESFGPLFYERCLAKVSNLKVLLGLQSVVESCVRRFSISLETYSTRDSQLLRVFFSKLKSPAMSNSKISKVFLETLSLKSSHSTLKSIELPQFIAMGCITKPVVAVLNDNMKLKVYEIVLEIGKAQHDTSVSHLLNKTLKVLPVCASLVCREVAKFHESLKEEKDSEVAAKKIKLEGNSVDETELQTDSMKGLIYLLEHVQAKRNIINPQLLVEVLLDSLLRMERKSLQNENVDYLVQLLLGCLLNLVKNKSGSTDMMTKELQKHLNVELLIRCIVGSENAKIHQDTLLILAFSASFCPEKILHSVMSVFTFMGDTMLRRDDSYSFQVIKQIIKCLVPALLTSKKYSSDEMVVKILQVFVDAISHIPAHRRSTIFGELLENVDSSTHLWRIVVLLIDQNVNKSSNNESDEDEKTDFGEKEISFVTISDLCLCLCHLNDTDIQIQCLSSIVQYMDNLPLTQDELKNLKKQTRSTDQFGLIDFKSRTFLQLNKMYHALLKFCTTLLSVQGAITSTFAVKDGKENGGDNENGGDKMEVSTSLSHFQTFVQVLMIYNAHVHTAKSDANNNNNESLKYHKLLQLKIAKLVEKVRTFLPECYFLIVAINLLSQKTPEPIKKQLLILLTQRISSHPFNVCDEEVALLLQLSKILTNELIEQSNSKSANTMCEATLHCLTRIFQVCKKSSNFDPTFVIPFLCDFIFSSILPGKQALASVVSCLSEVCEILQNHCIPHLPKIVPSLIYLLKNNHATKTELLVVRVLASLQKLLVSFNLFFKPYLVDILMEISLICQQNHFLTSTEVTNPMNSKLKTVISSIFTILATKIPARIIIPTLQQSYEKANESDASLVVATQEVIVQTLNNLSKSDLNLHSSALYNFFINTLTFRTQHNGKMELIALEEIELRSVNGFVAMLLKFPEGLFHSLYTRFTDWGCSEGTAITDSITYYRCMMVLVDKLKLLFSPLGGALLGRMSKALEEFAKYEEPENVEQVSLLTEQCRYAVESGKLCMLYCSNTSFNSETYQNIIQPLCDQLDSKSAASGQLESYLNDYVIPCIGQLADTSEDTSVCKTLHYAVLLKTRHSSAKVRCYSMDALAIIAKKLGNSYTSLLAETVPFLAELMEDGNEMVERKCQVIIKQMEDDIDENLQKYF